MNADVLRSNITKKYKEVKIPAEADMLFDFTRPHFEMRYYIVNELLTPIYIRDSRNIISRIPRTNTARYPGAVRKVHIRTVNAEIYERRFQHDVSEFRYYELIEDHLQKNHVIYIEELNVHISRDIKSLQNLRLSYNSRDKDIVVDDVSALLDRGKIFPITILLNDPSETYEEVYTVINKQIFSIPVHHDTNIGSNCVVRFSSPDEVVDQRVYHFETSTLFHEFDASGMYMVEIDQYKLPLYKDLITTRNKINADIKLENSKAFGLSAEERKAIEHKYEEIIRNQEETINALKRTQEKLVQERQMDAVLMETVVRNNKQNFDHHRQNMDYDNIHRNRAHSENVQNLQLKKEEARVKKSDNDVRSSNIGKSTALIKAAVVILPIIVGGLGYMAAKLGWVGVSFTGCEGAISEMSSGILSGIGTVVSSACSMVTSTIRTLFNWF